LDEEILSRQLSFHGGGGNLPSVLDGRFNNSDGLFFAVEVKKVSCSKPFLYPRLSIPHLPLAKRRWRVSIFSCCSLLWSKHIRGCDYVSPSRRSRIILLVAATGCQKNDDF